MRENNNVKLITKITGVINGVEFTCEGEGFWSRDTGQSTSALKFSNSIANFVPLLCKTWKCAHHRSIARPVDGAENIFEQYLEQGLTVFTFTTIDYPFANDRILCTSVCTRPTPDQQVVYQTRLGTYSGPTDIVRQLPFAEYLESVGSGKIVGQSSRQVKRVDGSRITIRYHEQIFLPDDFELPNSLIIRYGGDAVWTPEELTLRVESRTTLERATY